jgi:hypothetical protein
MNLTIPVSTKTLFKVLFSWLLLSGLAAVFLFSGISKLVAVETFKWLFRDLGVGNYNVATILAYGLICLEIWLGILLIAQVRLKQFTFPLSIAILILLSGYLVFLLFTQGNTGNCGCFGGLYMKPLPALLKNIAMISAILLLYRLHVPLHYSGSKWIALISVFLLAALPFTMEPFLKNQVQKIDLAPLYKTGKTNTPPTIDLRQGKHIVAFLSLTCPHCKHAALELERFYAANPALPIFLVLNGLPENEKVFFEETHAANMPHMLFTGITDFIGMAGPYVPAIYWVNNGVAERKVSYLDMSRAAMENWVNKK